ncbi:MAG: formylmethanofuran dehydrogenase [Clostridia bacterium]|nr:formylmethanofuran dehydrogenase [Clostridia bacterium]
MAYDVAAWEKSVAFHGHICPGLAIGFKAAQVGLNALGVARAEDEELVAIVENDACGVDAIQVLTGCTIGKGNLIYRDYGKQVYTFANRKTGEAVRVAVNPGLLDARDEEYRQLRQKVFGGTATQEERERFSVKHREAARWLLELPDDRFCQWKKIDLQLPGKARIFSSIICEECGEAAMEPRIRIKNGKKVCLACFGEEYGRGW